MSITKDDSYYENIDKRTREYKDWVLLKKIQLNKSNKGLGDVIEKVANVTGITKVVNTFFGEDCGCSDRKDALNDAMPFGIKAVNCIDEEDYNYLKSFFARARTRVDASQQVRLTEIYNHVFEQRMVPPAGCATCTQSGFIKAINKLHKYYDANSDMLDLKNNNEEE
jgi:hypothetical protein